jgi:hypothetical protein
VTGNILVHGFARAQGGGPLDSATFSASVQARITAPRGSQFSNGRLSIRAGAGKFDGTIAYDAPGSVNWTATFPPKGNDAAIAASAKNFEGVYLIGLSELTIGRLPVAGPAAGCGPIQQNGVTSFDRAAVNAGNAATPLVVNGVVQPDATSVAVTVTDGTTTLGPVTVTPTNGLFKATGFDVSGLADGTLTATATIATPAQTFNGASQTILKDVVAPPAPVASPPGGTFTGTQAVSLGDDDATAKIHYTTVGTTPGAASPTFAATPVTVDHSLTIRAIAIDAAGNVSPQASFAYTINTPPAPPAGGGGGGTPPPSGGTPPASGGPAPTIIQVVPLLPFQTVAPGQGVAGNGASSPARPAVSGLRLGVRGRALRVSMRLGSGANVVRFQVFRVKGGRQSGRALVTLTRVATGRSYRATLRLRALRAGRYVLVAQAGANTSALGAAARAPFSLH